MQTIKVSLQTAVGDGNLGGGGIDSTKCNTLPVGEIVKGI